MKEMPRLKVIKLARNPLEVASSRLNRNVVPGKSGWLGTYDNEDNILKLSHEEWVGLSDYQKILLD